MTVSAVTMVEGADATLPDGTSAALMPSTVGQIVTVVPAYAATSGDAPTVLADENGVKVQGTTSFTGMTAGTFNTPVSIGDAASSTTLIAANADRKGWTIQNMSTADLYVRIDGGTAALASCHRVLRQYESMGQKIMDGDLSLSAITGRWASDAGGTAVGGDWEE